MEISKDLNRYDLPNSGDLDHFLLCFNIRLACFDFFQNWKEMSYPLIQLLVFILVAASDIGTAIYYRYVLDKVQSIGYVAHFAGKVTIQRSVNQRFPVTSI